MKSPSACVAVLRLIYQGGSWPGIADALDGVSEIYYGLLDEFGEELRYEGYERQSAPRSGDGHAFNGGAILLQRTLTFPRSPGAAPLVTGFFTASAAVDGQRFHVGDVNPPIFVVEGVRPQLGVGTKIVET